MSTTLPLFWDLSSANKKQRIDASVKLVGALEQFQAQFVPKKPEEDTSATGEEDEEVDQEKGDGLDERNAQDVSYSIRRLVRGLGSSRESSRLGFAVALTELLSRIDTVTAAQILSLILSTSQTSNAMSGQEERDALFARLFGITALVRSGLLVRQHPSSSSSLDAFTESVSQLLSLATKKSWLREPAHWTLLLALERLHGSDVPWQSEAVQFVVEKVFEENESWSTEKVAVALRMRRMWPQSKWKQLLSPVFKEGEMLTGRNLEVVAKILKESSSEDEQDTVPITSAGQWRPQLHFAWDVLLDALLPPSQSSSDPSPVPARRTEGSFPDFYRVVVDETLFAHTSTPTRKYWGFLIFLRALPRVPADDTARLFTPNFMRTWMNHLAGRERALHKAARQVASALQSHVAAHPELGPTFVLQLTGAHGHGRRQFDALTKSKTVEGLLGAMDADGVRQYVDWLIESTAPSTEAEKSDVHALNGKRAWAVEQLGMLVRNGAIPKADAWIQVVLDWLAVHGLFVVRKSSSTNPNMALHSVPSPPFSDDLRKSCRARLLGCLADLTAHSATVKIDDKPIKLAPGIAWDGTLWVARVLSTIAVLDADAKHVAPLADADEEERVLCDKARGLADRLASVDGEAARGVQLLLLATVLQVRCAEDGEGGPVETLEACIDGATRMFPETHAAKKSKKSKSDAQADAQEEPEPEPVDVLIDTLIGFLEKSNAYMRTVANQVFGLLAGSVRGSTVDLILSQLERRDPTMADEEDEEMEGAEDEGEGESGGSSDADSDETSSLESEDEDISASGEEEDPELRQKIEEALRVNGVDDSDDSSDEELMDDEQMMAIDEQLAAAFRARAGEKRSGKDVNAQREATHFKNRVLDLVDILVKRQPRSVHIPKLILSLIALVTGTGADERQLADKAMGILRNRIGKLKEAPQQDEQGAAVHVDGAQLDELHARARRVHSADLLGTMSACSVYLARGVQTDAALRAYRTSLEDFLTRKSSPLTSRFFEDFVKRMPGVAWDLRGDLVDLSAKAVNVYRKCQAFHLVQVLVNQLPAAGPEPEDVSKFMKKLRKALVSLITSACDDQIALTAPQARELLKLGLTAVRHTQRVLADKMLSIWDPASWDALRSRLAGSEKLKASAGLQSMCVQLASVAGGQTGSKKAAAKADTAMTNGKASQLEEVTGQKHVNGKVKKRKAKDAGGEEGEKKVKRVKTKVIDSA